MTLNTFSDWHSPLVRKHFPNRISQSPFIPDEGGKEALSFNDVDKVNLPSLIFLSFSNGLFMFYVNIVYSSGVHIKSVCQHAQRLLWGFGWVVY
jgi:hypothetical protein